MPNTPDDRTTILALRKANGDKRVAVGEWVRPYRRTEIPQSNATETISVSCSRFRRMK